MSRGSPSNPLQFLADRPPRGDGPCAADACDSEFPAAAARGRTNVAHTTTNKKSGAGLLSHPPIAGSYLQALQIPLQAEPVTRPAKRDSAGCRSGFSPDGAVWGR